MELTLKRSVGELQTIVAATGMFFAENGIDPSVRMPVDLAIEELFVNMVKHNRGADREILLRLDRAGDRIEVCLVDRDVEPFDPASAPQVDVDAPLSERQPNGLGLYLVSKMVDSVHYEYRNRESRVTFSKKIENAT